MKAFINAILGLAMFAFGAFFLQRETATPPTHSGHIYFFGAIACLGLLVIRPDPIFTVIQKAIVIAGDTNIPWIGGKSADRRKPPTDS